MELSSIAQFRICFLLDPAQFMLKMFARQHDLLVVFSHFCEAFPWHVVYI